MAKPRTKWPFMPQQSTAVPTSAKSEKENSLPVLSTADAKKFGLENFGNTCYVNSVIQALYFCAPFRQLVVQATDNSVPPISSPSPPSPFAGPSQATNAGTSKSPPSRWKPERKHSYASQTQSRSSSEALHPPNGTTTSYSNTSPSPTLATLSTPQTNTYPYASGATSSSPLKPPTPTAPIPIPPHPPSLFSALRSLYVHISTHPSEGGTVSPRAFIEKLKEVNEVFRSTTMHQDAHEFLNFLLNKIVEEIEEEKRVAQQLKEKEAMVNGDDLSNSIATLSPTIVTTNSNSGTSPQDATLVHKLFEGVLTSETRCLTCETVSSRDESFLDLSIDIEQNSSVTACLRQFSASEMLCQKNKFFCDSCCDLQEAEKRMKIKRLPNVLALHLKRFKYQEDVQKYVKLAYRVAFPFDLRLFNTVDDAEDADRLYELFAIVVHIGNGPHHGHYISIIKTLGTWLVFDDVNVSAIAEADIPKYFGDPAGATSPNSGSAYVLYYQAKDIDLVGLGLKEPDSEPHSIAAERGEMVNGLGVSLDGGTISGGSVEEAPLLPPGIPQEGSAPSVSVSEPPAGESASQAQPASQSTTGLGTGAILNGVAASIMPAKTGMGNLLQSMTMRRSGSTSGHTHKPGRSSVSDGQFGPERVVRPISGVNVDEKQSTGVEGGEGSRKEGADKERKKEPEKKPSWLRKSFRMDKDKEKEKSGHGAFASEHAASSSPQDPSSLSGGWFKTSGHHSKARRPSEPVSLFDHMHIGHYHNHGSDHNHNHDHNGVNGTSTNSNAVESQGPPRSFKVIRPRTSTGVGPSSSLAMTELNGDTINGYDSAVSTSSSHNSAPLSTSAPPMTPSRSLDTSQAASTGANAKEGRHLRPLPPVPKSPDHKKSLTHLPSMKKDMLRGLPSIPRPLSAGNQSSPKPPPEPPVPSPAIPSAYAMHSRNPSNGYIAGSPRDPNATFKGKNREDGLGYVDDAGNRMSSVLDGAAAPHVMMGSPESALSSTLTVGVSSSAGSGSSSASSNFKRATRKLSLTAPMLGFGKRDKDKEERHRERDERHREKGTRDRERTQDRAKDFPSYAIAPRF